VEWEGEQYSRLDAATTLFHSCAPFLVQAVEGASGDVVKATQTVNQAFRMENDFPIFMAVMDVACVTSRQL
jgi:hypothetical protein